MRRLATIVALSVVTAGCALAPRLSGRPVDLDRIEKQLLDIDEREYDGLLCVYGWASDAFYHVNDLIPASDQNYYSGCDKEGVIGLAWRIASAGNIGLSQRKREWLDSMWRQREPALIFNYSVVEGENGRKQLLTSIRYNPLSFAVSR